MLKRCLFIFSLLLITLSNLVLAGGFTENKNLFYGLYISNFGITLVRQGHDTGSTIYSATTFSHPKLFSDPPNLVFNDSPVNFISLMFDSGVIAALKKENSQYGDDVERQLYIGAAGYDAAVKQMLADDVPDTSVTLTKKIHTAIDSSHLNGALDIDVNAKLEQFGCYSESNKAEFHTCAIRWSLQYQTGVKFDKSATIVEQDNNLMSEMANVFIRENKLQPTRHFILQATSFAQPYLNSPKGIVSTPLWMGSGSASAPSFARGGLLYEVGIRYWLLQEDKKNMPAELNSVLEKMLQAHAAKDGKFVVANKEMETDTAYSMMMNNRRKNNTGGMLLNIADPDATSDILKQTNLSEADLAKAQQQVSGIISAVRDHGALSLALFLGLLEPSIEDGSNIIIVGEFAEWFADWQKKSVPTVLASITDEETKLDQAYDDYNKLVEESLSQGKFGQFDQIFSIKRKRKPEELSATKTKAEFKTWLTNLQAKVVNNVHYISEKKYQDYMILAARARYTKIKPVSPQ